MQIIANNKKAYYDYFIEETIEAGIVLVGTEVKSIQEGACSMKDGYIRIDGNEVSVIGMHIPVYSNGNIFNHDPDRVRKLLLNKAEIRKLRQKTEQAGYTLVPTKVYFNDKHLVKVEVMKIQKNIFFLIIYNLISLVTGCDKHIKEVLL